MGDKSKSLNVHSHAQNPLEAAFDKAWAEISGSVLPHILDKGGVPACPSDRDEAVAATVVQWLGSPVGRRFVEKVMAGEAE